MTITLYVEGGGNNKDTIVRCRQGFSEYCRNVAPGCRPRIVACGGRQQAYERFMIEARSERGDDICALLVDSECPLAPGLSSVDFLRTVEKWTFPIGCRTRIFLMVQAMEAWFLADRDALASYYGPEFRRNALPGDERHIELIPRNDLESSLVRASRGMKTKEEYHKTRHGFALLAIIDPAKVERGSARAAEFHKFLRSL